MERRSLTQCYPDTVATATLRNARTYSVRPGFGAQRSALLYYGKRRVVEEECASVVLVDLEVLRAPSPPQLERWHQQGSKQVPYDEIYTTLDRSRVIGHRFDPPAEPDFALSFFLHYFDEGRPLQTPWGIVTLPTPEELRPAHLQDRKYSFWN